MPRFTVTKHGLHPIDVHVGGRVRLRRTLLGMTQSGLGEALGLTFQQVQKYERGTNRISASRLYQLSQLLDAPVSFFFEDAPRIGDGAALKKAKVEQSEVDAMLKRETLELVRAYYRINDDAARKRLRELVQAIAAMGESASG